MRFIAQRVPDGAFLHPELPVETWSFTDTLSGPQALSVTFHASHDLPIFKKGHAAIWAEVNDRLYGGIIDTVTRDQATVSVECAGFSSMLQGQPYIGDGEVWSKVDPLVVTRFIWDHWQSFPQGDLGVRVDSTTSPIRIGEEQYVPLDTTLSEFDTTFDDGPIRLSWYESHNLGGMIDGYVKEGYFDYHEQSRWKGDRIEHRMRLYYPRKGKRRQDLRFVYGENILEPPTVEMQEDGYASEVMLLGAGEGRAKKRAFAGGKGSGIRHVAVVTEDKIKRQRDADARARREYAKRKGEYEVRGVTVLDHPHAPIGSWSVGDEVRVQGDVAGKDIDQWVRVISSTRGSEKADSATLEVRRVP